MLDFHDWNCAGKCFVEENYDNVLPCSGVCYKDAPIGQLESEVQLAYIDFHESKIHVFSGRF